MKLIDLMSHKVDQDSLTRAKNMLYERKQCGKKNYKNNLYEVNKMTIEHATEHSTINACAETCKRIERKNIKKQRTFKKDALEHASNVLDALIADADVAKTSTITAEVIVRHNIEKIVMLRNKGVPLCRIYEMMNKQIKLGIGRASFERYVRLAGGQKVTKAQWSCPECVGKSVRAEKNGRTWWQCPICKAFYADDAGKLSQKRLTAKKEA